MTDKSRETFRAWWLSIEKEPSYQECFEAGRKQAELAAQPVEPDVDEALALLAKAVRSLIYSAKEANCVATISINQDGWRRECEATDRMLARAGFNPIDFRSEGGNLICHRLVDAIDARVEASLMEAYRAIQNCLLAMPDGKFKREMDDWLTTKLLDRPAAGARE